MITLTLKYLTESKNLSLSELLKISVDTLTVYVIQDCDGKPLKVILPWRIVGDPQLVSELVAIFEEGIFSDDTKTTEELGA